MVQIHPGVPDERKYMFFAHMINICSVVVFFASTFKDDPTKVSTGIQVAMMLTLWAIFIGISELVDKK